jgi:hypothetical protein
VNNKLALIFGGSRGIGGTDGDSAKGADKASWMHGQIVQPNGGMI